MNVNRQAARSQATRAKLLRAARTLFARRGYATVGTEEIVRRAGVTRGALYHQFEDKLALFHAVVEEVDGELTQRIAERALSFDDRFEGLREGFSLWLDACADPTVQRIILQDAPAVLGWEAWRELGERYGLGVVMIGLQLAMDEGEIEPQPVRALAHIVVGALEEAALYVSRADDPVAARADMDVVVGRMLDGLRARPPG